MSQFLVSSLQTIGAGQALIGGIVTSGELRLGDMLTTPGNSEQEPVQQIRAYGRELESVPSGMPAGLVVGLEWAKTLTLCIQLECRPS